jgi:CheY-like chemotaxis protein
VAVIYMRRNDNPTVREAALASGCIAFLTKPFSVHELIEPQNGVVGFLKGGAQ